MTWMQVPGEKLLEPVVNLVFTHFFVYFTVLILMHVTLRRLMDTQGNNAWFCCRFSLHFCSILKEIENARFLLTLPNAIRRKSTYAQSFEFLQTFTRICFQL